VVAEITPTAAERIEFYGRRLAVGDRITMCPDVVCGRCYECTHVLGYVWCENSEYALEGFNSGDTVVVIGTGPLGLLHVAKADMMGAGQIIATDLSEHRLAWARRCGAEHVLNASTTTAEERVARVRELTGGRGADVVLHMANTPKSFVEGIEMLKRGGMMLEMGNFADTGEISLNVHRHVCSKNIRLVGLTNHPSTGYGPALRLLERYADRYPFAEMVTHEFGLHQADEALHTSTDPRSMKVAIVPGLTT